MASTPAQFVNVTDPKKACRLPTPADIERLEAGIGSRVPAGFRGFIQVFGPGHMAVVRGWLRIFAAYAPEKPSGIYDILGLREYRGTRRWMRGRQVYRLVVFASDQTGDQDGWDPEDVTDPAAPEYRVYCWRRGEDHVAYKLTRTFEGIIRLFTNQTEWRTRMRTKASNPGIADPPFDYFKKEDGTAISGVPGSSLAAGVRAAYLRIRLNNDDLCGHGSPGASHDRCVPVFFRGEPSSLKETLTMRPILLIATLLSVVATAVGWAGDEDTEKELLGLSRRIDDAYKKADTDFLADVLADDWIAIESHGIRDKAALLKALKEGSTKFIAIKTGEVKVRVHGDAAVVTGFYSVESLSRGREARPFGDVGSFGRVFVRKGGRWQCVHSQSTPNVGWQQGGGRPTPK